MKVGLDIGYSSVKIASGGERAPELMRLPIGAAPISECGTAADGGAAIGAGHVVMLDGEEWVAGIEPAKISGFQPTMDEDYSSTPEYRALFLAALSAVGAPQIDRLVTGLPVTHFKEAAKKERLQKMMLGTHEIRPGFKVEVKAVSVVPQPAGAFGALTLDGMLGRTDFRVSGTASVLVVDPGHYSLDWVVFNGGFDMKSSGSTSNAGEAMIKAAAESLSAKHGIRVRPLKLQDAITSGSAQPLVIGTHEINYAGALEEAANDIVRSNLRSLRGSVRIVNDQRGVDVVLIAGGGAKLFKKALAEVFPESRVEVLRDSITANARGFFAYASTTKAA